MIRLSGIQQVEDALKKELDKLRGEQVVLVGIHESAGVVEGEDITMATLGAIQHYGNDRIPARRWLDVGVESGNDEYLDIVQEGIENGLPSNQILEQVGATAAATTRDYINELKTPANAPSTIRKKKSDNPLVDTAAMRNSVTHVVARDLPLEGLE